MAGNRAALREYQTTQRLETLKSLEEQYQLGLQDLEAGRLDLARQRFEYVLNSDPGFPGVAEMLIQVAQVLYATSTPTAIPPSATPTPTQDLRPVQDLFAQAQSDYSGGNWTGTIDVLLALRKEDPSYRVVEVDSLLYRSLRHRGVEKIRAEASLEGGLYDLSLAESFGPLDSTAQNWRNLARIYVIGLGFWEVYPELAVYYFAQVSAAAPGLRDASGWTASGRYWASLVQYGDWLAAQEDWCTAAEQYVAALARGSDAALAEKAENARIKCSPPTNTPRPSSTATESIPSLTLPADTPTATSSGGIPTTTLTQTTTNTPGVTCQPSTTPTPTQSPLPAFTNTQPPPPSSTPAPLPTQEPTGTTSAPYPVVTR